MNFLTLLAINTDHLLTALEIMWKGVLAIAIVIALVILVTNIVNKVCVNMEKSAAAKKAAKEAEEENNRQ